MTVRKLYCYVDENGQDTEGHLFIVAVVVTEENRDELQSLCEQLERVSGKRKDKWGKARYERRLQYIRLIFADNRFKGCLRYLVFYRTRDYDSATVAAIVRGAKWKMACDKFTTLVYVDGLTKTKRQEYGIGLRRMGLPVRRIRGVTRDESNALIRLVDTIAGFVRDALDEDSTEVKAILRKAKREEMLIELGA